MNGTTEAERMYAEQLAKQIGDTDWVPLSVELTLKLVNDADHLARAEELLREMSEYFDNYADVTDSDRGVAEVPNEAMEWKLRIDSCLSGD